MRRIAKLLALALCLGLLAGCGVEDILGGMMGPREAQATAVPSPTEVPIWTPPASPDPAASAQPAAPGASESPASSGGIADYGSLTAADCVADALDQAGVLPRVTLDCPGAASINAAILDTFSETAADPMWDVHYECAIGAGRFLSVLIVEQINDSMFHTAYNLDLSTGQAVTGPELLALLGQDEGTLKIRELETLAAEFTRQFGAFRDQMDQTFYDQQYARTTALDNAETEKLWFAADGQLYFAGRIYGMAGAEYYEYPLPAGVTL